MTEEVEIPDETPEPKWWLDEGVPGAGERPAWLNEKFKSVADLNKCYNELEKKLGTAPDDYDFSKASWIDPDYVPFQELKDFAKSKRVPAEVMDKVVESMDKYFNEFTIDPAEEVKKLGDNAKERITLLNNWAKSNLTEDSFVALTSSMRTADAVKALEEIRNKMIDSNTVIPNGNAGSDSSNFSLADIQSEMSANLTKYKTDPAYRKELQAKMEIAARNSSYVDKSGA